MLYKILQEGHKFKGLIEKKKWIKGSKIFCVHNKKYYDLKDNNNKNYIDYLEDNGKMDIMYYI